MGQGKFIAVVDDDVSVREAITDLLEAYGYEVAGFASARAFLESTRREDVACLLSDVRMVGTDGLDLQQQLLALRRAPPIIFMTAFNDDVARARAISGGALAFLTKPVDGKTLLAHIRVALSRQG